MGPLTNIANAAALRKSFRMRSLFMLSELRQVVSARDVAHGRAVPRPDSSGRPCWHTQANRCRHECVRHIYFAGSSAFCPSGNCMSNAVSKAAVAVYWDISETRSTRPFFPYNRSACAKVSDDTLRWPNNSRPS